jgi:hypothetical protein
VNIEQVDHPLGLINPGSSWQRALHLNLATGERNGKL